MALAGRRILLLTSVAGKTGTAQVAEKGSMRKKVGRLVCGVWPYDSPQYVMLIVMGEPSKGRYYGGDVAGPVFKAIVEDMALLNL